MDTNRQPKESSAMQKQEKSMKEKLRDAISETLQSPKGETNPDTVAAIKTVAIAGAVVLAFWSSRYILLALAETIRAWKELRRSIREK